VEATRPWTGEAWQEEALSLLRFRHRQDSFQPVPDRHGGDLGLEAFTRNGFAYQCYAVLEPATVKQRYEKQRDKVTRDIGKFIENRSELEQLLRGFPIRRWCLVVPFYDSANLAVFCAEKSREVIQENLPYVANDFAIDLIDAANLSFEKNALVNVGIGHVETALAVPTSETLDDWVSHNDPLVSQLDGKVSRMRGLSDDDKRAFRNAVLKHYVQGQNVREQLREAFLPLLEQAEQTKREKENFLQAQTMLLRGEPTDIIQQTLEDYRNRLRESVIGLGPSTREALAWEAISDWLLRCPLDFRTGAK
jgi:hypothetical protein